MPIRKIITIFAVACFATVPASHASSETGDCEKIATDIGALKTQIGLLDLKIYNLEDDTTARHPGISTGELNAVVSFETKKLLRERNELAREYNALLQDYENCVAETDSLFEEGSSAYKRGDYLTAIGKYKEYLEYVPNNDSAKNNLVLSLNKQGDVHYAKSEYANALGYYKEAADYDGGNQKAILLTGVMYYNLKDYASAKYWLQKSYDVSTDPDYIGIAKGILEDISSKEGLAEKRKEEAAKQLTKKIDRWFVKIQTKYRKLDAGKKKLKYENLRISLSSYQGKLSDEKQLILDYILSLIDKELSK